MRHSSIVVQIENVGAKSYPVDHEVGAVANADLVELVEELVGRVARKDVREPGLDTDPDDREQPGRDPLLVRLELEVAEHHARLAVRALRMRLRQRRRHVEIRAARLEGCGEDLRVEARIGRVQHRVGLRIPQHRGEPVDVGGVDAGRREPAVVEPCDDARRPVEIEVADDHPVEEVAPLRDRGGRCADAARPDDDDLHVPAGTTSTAASTASDNRRSARSALGDAAF